MKLRNAWSIGAEMLSRSESADLDARLLLEHALDVSHSYLLAHASDTLSAETIVRYFHLIARAERNEPVPYILGTVPFRYVDIAVTPAVLIPRPETEQLVDLVKAHVAGREGLRIVDVGTGSGCIAISLAHELPTAAVSAVEISAEALIIAKQNGARNGVAVTWLSGSLLEPTNGLFDIIVSNPPYVAENERHLLGESVRAFEPQMALFGGEDGLDLVRDLLAQSANKLAANGALFVEIGFQQGVAAVALAQAIFPNASVSCQPDYAGRDRFLIVKH